MIYDGIITKPSMDSILQHHGILGQKWGKKNGPPYPLDSKVSTGKRLIQKVRRKTKKYQKDLKSYEANNLMTIASRRDQANYTKWSKEAKNKKDQEAWAEAAKFYKDEADRSQKYLDDFVKKYGEHKLEDLMTKKDLEWMNQEKEYAEKIFKEVKKSENLDKAKKEDQWDINFLEAVQNKEWFDNKNKMLKEYSKYLDDPEQYWRNRHDI